MVVRRSGNDKREGKEAIYETIKKRYKRQKRNGRMKAIKDAFQETIVEGKLP